MKYFIIHYHEIALKGRNRTFFEKKLIDNIKKVLSPFKDITVKRISGRFLISFRDQEEEIKECLKKIFGIAFFSLAWKSAQELKELQEDVWKEMKGLKEGYRTFRVSVKRSNKDFPLTSPEIEREVGSFLKEKSNLEVSLKNSDLTVFIEIVEKFSFFYFQRFKGLGGLPVGVSGKTVSLLSSGFDSPAASYFTMKRGAEVVFLHFHSYPSTSRQSINNVIDLVKILNKYQFYSKLYLIPFLDIQKEIIKLTVDYRVILYRRMMIRIANEIAEKEKAFALITGENLGQVASQTLENIKVINEVSRFPIFRPLIGFDKEEIIDKAKEIGTYNISCKPHEDCCSLFVSKHPVTRAQLKEVEKIEEKLDIKKLINKAMENGEIKSFV